MVACGRIGAVVDPAAGSGDGTGEGLRLVDVDAMPYRCKRERVHVKSLTGAVSQLCFIKLEPGAATDHAHPEEQIGYVLRGAVEVTVDGSGTVLGPGDGYVIPAGVRHGFRVVSAEPVEYIEVFAPPKESNR